MDISVLGAAGLLALVWKFVDFARLVANAKTCLSEIFTQVLAWAAGVAAVGMYAGTDFSSSVQVGGIPLNKLNLMSLLLVGFMVGSSASVAVDVKKAVDGTDSASKPRLIP